MLAFANVAQYLLARGDLNAQTLVDDGLIVRDVSSRHLNFRVEIPAGGGYHLKQGAGPDACAAIAREASAYRDFAPVEARLAGVIPTFRDYDAREGILILELVPDAEDLRTLALRTGTCGMDVAAAIGDALACVHSVASPVALAHLPCPPPPFLALYRPTAEIFRTASAANLQLIRIVQSSSELCARLDALRQALRCETLLHNDIKWDNFLMTPTGLKIVDWESLAFGDPAWDVGSAFGQYLSYWLFSIPATGYEPAANFAELATFPLPVMKAALNACWTAYFVARGLKGAAATDFLMRAVAMTGVRLLQSAFEASQYAAQLTSSDILHIQLATNILERPVEACRQLLGLPIQGLP